MQNIFEVKCLHSMYKYISLIHFLECGMSLKFKTMKDIHSGIKNILLFHMQWSVSYLVRLVYLRRELVHLSCLHLKYVAQMSWLMSQIDQSHKIRNRPLSSKLIPLTIRRIFKISLKNLSNFWKSKQQTQFFQYFRKYWYYELNF